MWSRVAVCVSAVAATALHWHCMRGVRRDGCSYSFRKKHGIILQKKERKKHGISKFSNSWEISGCDFWNCNVALFSETVQGDSEYTPVAISKAHSCFNCLDLQIKSKAEEGNSFMACVVCELLHASTAASTDLSRLLLLLDEQKNCRREGIISLPARPCQMRVPTFKAVLH